MAHSKRPAGFQFGIDLGNTSTNVAVREVFNPANSADSVVYPLEFASRNGDHHSKTTTELDSTIVFSEDGRDCFFGQDGFTRSKTHIFSQWKLGLLGEPPFAGSLANTCRALEASAPQLAPFTPATLFRRLFRYILETARAHLERRHGSLSDAEFYSTECYLTYPVSCSESLRLLLRQEASAAGLNVMGAVSESMSIASALNTITHLSLPPGAWLILDFGGATVDAAAVFEDEGHIAQACPTHGYRGGGQMVNHLIREWLKKMCPDWTALHDDEQWIRGGVSSQIERCKREFSGRSDHAVWDGYGHEVTIPAKEMQGFFRPLMTGAVNLATSVCALAESAGHPIVAVVVCGGPVRNWWFLRQLKTQLQKSLGFHDDAIKDIQEPGIVARGGLCYADHPQWVEKCVIDRSLGLEYRGDYSKSGERRLRGGRQWKGIGWILREGQDPQALPGCIRFTKMVKPHSTDPGDCLITSEIYVAPVGSSEFAKKHIETNDLIEWDCDITYPAAKAVISQLFHLGTFLGILPHDKLFSPDTTTKLTQVEFRLTIKVRKGLLEGRFSAVLQDNSLCPLEDVRYIPLPLRPRTEYANRIPVSDYYIRERTGLKGMRAVSEDRGSGTPAMVTSTSPAGSPDPPRAGVAHSNAIPTGITETTAEFESFLATMATMNSLHTYLTARPESDPLVGVSPASIAPPLDHERIQTMLRELQQGQNDRRKRRRLSGDIRLDQHFLPSYPWPAMPQRRFQSLSSS